MNRRFVLDTNLQDKQPTPDGAFSIIDQAPLTSLSDMALTVGRHWRGLSIWLAVCLASTAWYLHVTPAEYSAAATVILEPRRQTVPTQDGASASYPPTLDSAQAESQIQVIRSERILAFVFDLLDLRHAPEFADPGPSLITRALIATGRKDQIGGAVARALAAVGIQPRIDSGGLDPDATERARAFQAFSDRVGVRRIGQSYVLEVSYRALSPDAASQIANAVTSAYIRSQVDLKAAAAHNGSEYLQERISDIKAEQDAALDGVRRGQIPAFLFPDADARIIGAALRPLSKSSPKTVLLLLFALSFGALTGLITIAVRHALDRTLTSRSHVRQALEVECLGVIPEVARMGGIRAERRRTLLGQAVIKAPGSGFAQAFRATRTAVLLSAPAGKRRAIGLVSWSHGEGRTTVASNLAHLLAVSGNAVDLVDGDLHNPVLTRRLAPRAAIGVNEVLTLLHPGELAVEQLTGSLRLIPAVASGRVSEPNIFLGSLEMQNFLADLRVDRDVVVDLPPLAVSSDAQALSPFLDGVVLVIEAGRTNVDDARDALRVLRNANAHVLGVILNKVKPTESSRARRSVSFTKLDHRQA